MLHINPWAKLAWARLPVAAWQLMPRPLLLAMRHAARGHAPRVSYTPPPPPPPLTPMPKQAGRIRCPVAGRHTRARVV
jgi:hypothetical protein